MSVQKHLSKFDFQPIKQHYIEIIIDFYVRIFHEKDTFNFATSLSLQHLKNRVFRMEKLLKSNFPGRMNKEISYKEIS